MPKPTPESASKGKPSQATKPGKNGSSQRAELSRHDGVLVAKALDPMLLVPAPASHEGGSKEERVAALLESTTRAMNAVWNHANEELRKIHPDTPAICHRVRATLHTNKKGQPDGNLRLFACRITKKGPDSGFERPLNKLDPANECC